MKSFIATAAFAASASAVLYPGQSSQNHTCVLQKPLLSCSDKATPDNVDTCCVETFGGLVLQTQFWQTWTGYESKGQLIPKDTWTIHGLWPDFCNGSYTQYCDLSRQYDPYPSPNTTTGKKDGTPVPAYTGPNIGTFLEPLGKYDLLAYMNKYWIAQGQYNSDLWAHEFSKHATCFSTFDVPCYGPEYRQHEEVASYFETTINYYKKFTTFDFLADHGIVPSNKTTYTLSAFENALQEEYTQIPYVGCSGPRYNETAEGKGSLDNGRTVLSEVWYYMHVRGRPQNGRYEPLVRNGKSNCAAAAGAIHYYEQTPASVYEDSAKSNDDDECDYE